VRSSIKAPPFRFIGKAFFLQSCSFCYSPPQRAAGIRYATNDGFNYRFCANFTKFDELHQNFKTHHKSLLISRTSRRITLSALLQICLFRILFKVRGRYASTAVQINLKSFLEVAWLGGHSLFGSVRATPPAVLSHPPCSFIQSSAEWEKRNINHRVAGAEWVHQILVRTESVAVKQFYKNLGFPAVWHSDCSTSISF
jgi:hypothetical protein